MSGPLKGLDLLLLSIAPEIADKYIGKTIGKKEINDILGFIARNRPDDFPSSLSKMSQSGLTAAWRQGETHRFSDLEPMFDKRPFLNQLYARYAEIDSDPALSDAEKEAQKVAERSELTDVFDDMTFSMGMERGNNIALSVASGARGNRSQLRAMLTTPGVYSDYKDQQIPIFVTRGFNEGITPIEYLAASFGARKAVTSTKRATADAGDLLKQLNNVVSRMVVTEEDCGTDNGIDRPASHEAHLGGYLVNGVAGYEAGTLIDKSVFEDIKSRHKGPVVTRSPMTCQAHSGVCKKCVGGGKHLKFPNIGDHVGKQAAQAVGTPLAQASLNCLAKGTKVRMADNSIRNIEEIKKGEFVLGADIHGKTFPVLVTEVWDQGVQPASLHRLFRENTQETINVIATSPHEFLTSRIDMENPQENKFRKTCIGNKSENNFLIADGKHTDVAHRYNIEFVGDVHCFDITVDHPDSLFVLACGLITSNTKHVGGMGKGRAKFTGLDVVAQILQSPEMFPNKAAVSLTAGTVSAITPAPQGGSFVTVGDQKHYILPGFDILVTEGDEVEAGDILSDGLLDVEDIVQTRGLGEGRRALMSQLGDVLKNTKVDIGARDLELVVRPAVNHLRLTGNDSKGPFLPEDILTYEDFLSVYTPAETTKFVSPEKAVGKYLEKPTLHFTPKTKLTPSMVDRISKAGFSQIPVSDDPGEFEPDYVRLRTSAPSQEDWLSSQMGSYIKSRLESGAVRGTTTPVEGGYDWTSRLAQGNDFAQDVHKTGKF